MKKLKTLLTIPFTISLITLIAAGCSSNENTLRRPVGDSSSTTQGEIAGTEITELPKKNISVATTNVEVEVADTDATRAQGLSGRKNLADGKGMLFDFTKSELRKPGFWMKDMFMSIDMIWINNGKIIGVTKDVPLPTEGKSLETYNPPSEITHVLEVPAGWSQRTNINVGDSVTL